VQELSFNPHNQQEKGPPYAPPNPPLTFDRAKLAQLSRAEGSSRGSQQPVAQAAGRDKHRAWLVAAALTPSHTKTRNYKHLPAKKKPNHQSVEEKPPNQLDPK